MQLDTEFKCQEVAGYLVAALDCFLPELQLKFARGSVENAAQGRGFQFLLGIII